MRELPGMMTTAIARIALVVLGLSTAKMAVSTRITRRAAEIRPRGLRRSVAHRARVWLTVSTGMSSTGRACTVTVDIGASSVADPRVEPGVRQVDHEVQGHEGRRDEHD